METVMITVRSEAGRHRVEALLRDVEGVTGIRIVDEVTQLSESSLTDEWNSEEDQRWEDLL
jgi:hypothetical protein